ncbi:uncharacterized protein LOC105186147 isoform X1 [Harpegnathos saltator]|uniref:uncharacterized protein LOC105186147 isoform X1 n=1 Tax=Harpegnathos saltator TaxID=610380 RepID=UPI000DBED875|nr:uncharacterized protein LOC105186147 isoform X1 [Harpegnathos saltator]
MNSSNSMEIVSKTIDQVLQPEKVTESLLLMKQKIYKTDNLIKLYTDKIKEADRLKLDLETTKKNNNHMTANYRSVIDKTRELELNNTEVKQENNQLQKKIKEYKLLLATDEKQVKELTAKMKEMEDTHSTEILKNDLQKASLEDKIKELEHQLKMSKLENEKQKTNTVTTGIKSTADVGINVSLSAVELKKKSEVQEKNVMTDEFYPLDDDPYPIFCSKCNAYMYPPPVEQICQIMSVCPDLIEPIFSPRAISPLSLLHDKEPEYSDKNVQYKEIKHLNKNIPDKESEHFNKNVPNSNPGHSDRNIPNKRTDSKELEHLHGNEMASTFKVSSSHLETPCYNSVNGTYNFKLESKNSSALEQDYANVQFKNEVHTKYCKPIAMNLSNDQDLIAKHNSSINNMEKTIRVMKRKLKQLQKKKKKENKQNCCHHNATSCNNVTATTASLLNPDLLVSVCQSMIKFCANKKKVRNTNEDEKNKREIKSKKYKHKMKRMKLKRLNKMKDKSSWKVEHLHEIFLQDTVNTDSEKDLNVDINESGLSNQNFLNHSTEVKSIGETEYTAEMECTTEGESTEMEYTTETKSANIECIAERGSAEMECAAKTGSAKMKFAEVEYTEKIESAEVKYTGKIDSAEVEYTAEMESAAITKSIPKIKPVADVESDAKVTPVHADSDAKAMSVTGVESNAKVMPVADMEAHVKVTHVAHAGSDAKAMPPVADIESIVNNPMILHSDVDEIYVSNSLSTDNVESVTLNPHDSNHHTVTKTMLSRSHSESSSSYSNGNVIGKITIGSNFKNKRKTVNRLLKKVKNLKRKTQMNSVILPNKHLKVEPSSNDTSEFYNSMKKRRIAHTPKASASPPGTVEKNSTDLTIGSIIEPEVFTNFSSNMQTPKDDTPIKTQKKRGKNIKNNLVESIREHIPNKKLLTKKTLHITKTEDSSLHNDNVTLFDNNIEQLLASFSHHFSPDDTLVSSNTVNGIMSPSKESTSSNALCKDSKDYELTEDLHTNTTEVTGNISPPVKLHSTATLKSFTYKNCDYKSDMTKGTTDEASENRSTEGQSSDVEVREDDLSVTDEENCTTSKEHDEQNVVGSVEAHDTNNKSVKKKYLHSSLLKRRNIVKSSLDDNAKESYDEINMKMREECVNNEETRILGLDMRSEMIDKCIERIYGNNDDDETDDNDFNCKKYMEEQDDNVIDNDVKMSYDDVGDNNNKDSDNDKDHEDDQDEDDQSLTPINQLRRYVNKNLKRNVKRLTYKERKKAIKIVTIAGKFVKKQLMRLMQSNWEDSIHCGIVDKLRRICGPNLIAKCIVEFLSEYSEYNRVLDKSFTPPAPLMSRYEQKIMMLLIDLERSKPTVIASVRTAIQYKLFQLSGKLRFSEVESFTRIYVVLARLQNDREAVRIMCCDALYCMGYHAINVLYTALTSWPEIFPHADAHKGFLPRCIAFLISQSSDNTYQKSQPLRMLMSKYYGYTEQIKVEDFADELMTAFADKKEDGLNTAIILLAKRNGSTWTYDNIIKTPLLPMIICQRYLCMYNAFSLLGKLMRAFPLKSKDTIVQDMSNQLADLLASDEFPGDVQQGIASALLSLARQEFHKVTIAVMKWTPKKTLRPSIIAQIDAHIKKRTPKFWKMYIQKELFEIYPK